MPTIDVTKLTAFTQLFEEEGSNEIGISHGSVTVEANIMVVELAFPISPRSPNSAKEFLQVAQRWVSRAEDGMNLSSLAIKAASQFRQNAEIESAAMIDKILNSTCWRALILSLSEHLKNSGHSVIQKNQELINSGQGAICQSEVLISISSKILPTSTDRPLFEVQYSDEGLGFKGPGFEALQDGKEHDVTECLQQRAQKLTEMANKNGDLFLPSDKVLSSNSNNAIGGRGIGLQRAWEEFKLYHVNEGGTVTLSNSPTGGACITFRSVNILADMLLDDTSHVAPMRQNDRRHSGPKLAKLPTPLPVIDTRKLGSKTSSPQLAPDSAASSGSGLSAGSTPQTPRKPLLRKAASDLTLNFCGLSGESSTAAPLTRVYSALQLPEPLMPLTSAKSEPTIPSALIEEKEKKSPSSP